VEKRVLTFGFFYHVKH